MPGACHQPRNGAIQTYPDYRNQNTGVLYPYNMECSVFTPQKRAWAMGTKFPQRFRAAGQLSKNEHQEMVCAPNLAKLVPVARLAGLSRTGFGIHRHPRRIHGSKGITACRVPSIILRLVPLLIAPEYCYSSDETANFCIKIANYSEQSLHHAKLSWTINKDNGDVMAMVLWTFPYDNGLFGEILFKKSTSIRRGATIWPSLSMAQNIENTYRYGSTRHQRPETARKNIIITTKMTDEIGKN